MRNANEHDQVGYRRGRFRRQKTRGGILRHVRCQETRDVSPMLSRCWVSVVDAGPASRQHWILCTANECSRMRCQGSAGGPIRMCHLRCDDLQCLLSRAPLRFLLKSVFIDLWSAGDTGFLLEFTSNTCICVLSYCIFNEFSARGV